MTQNAMCLIVVLHSQSCLQHVCRLYKYCGRCTIVGYVPVQRSRTLRFTARRGLFPDGVDPSVAVGVGPALHELAVATDGPGDVGGLRDRVSRGEAVPSARRSSGRGPAPAIDPGPRVLVP